MFETGFEGHEYATHGGTLFVIRYKEIYYGITCNHVNVKDPFDWGKLVVTDHKFGKRVSGISHFYVTSAYTDLAEETELLDIRIAELDNDKGALFFNDKTYLVDRHTIGGSQVGDQLRVYGCLKHESKIEDEVITPKFCKLGFVDTLDDVIGSDVTVRTATGFYTNPEFKALTGLSGAPVFNETTEKLCGVVVRGGLDGETAKITYVKFLDVMKVLEAIRDDQNLIKYNPI